MDGWKIVYDSYVPEEEPLREALCTLGNGYFATRGAFKGFTVNHIHYPGTYFAGGYNRLKSEVAGRIIENEDLVNWPDWLNLRFRIGDDPWIDLDKKLIRIRSQGGGAGSICIFINSEKFLLEPGEEITSGYH